jgi:hypothetical protein
MVATKLETKVTYGMGAECKAVLPFPQLKGKSVRQIIQTVADTPQSNDKALLTARTIREVIASGRIVNVEVARGRRTDNTDDDPKQLDDIVIPDTGNLPADRTESLNIGLSEDYVGGSFTEG